MANEVERDTSLLVKNSRIVVQLTLDELQNMMIQAADLAFKRNVDVFKFWEKFPDSMTKNQAMEALNVKLTKFTEMEKSETIRRHNTKWGIRYKKEELFELFESSNHFSYMRMKARKRKKTA